MEVTATLDAPCPPVELYGWVVDLEHYPKWLDIVPRVSRLSDETDGPAWSVDLRGRVGPFARSKRLRMVRTRDDAPTAVRFEREELDGRSHSPWTLDAQVSPRGDGGSRLTMRLAYDGRLWGPLVERLLSDEIERSKPRLLALVASSGRRER